MAGFRAERGFSPLLASRLALINSELEELTIGQVGEIMARYAGMDSQMRGLILEEYDERMAMVAEGRERTADDIKKALGIDAASRFDYDEEKERAKKEKWRR